VDGFEEDADLKEGGHVLNVKKVVLEFFNRIFNRVAMAVAKPSDKND